MDAKIYDEPSKVEAEDGAVVIHGPDGVFVTLTAEAAELTSDRLLFGAGQAKRQLKAAGKRPART